MQTTEVQRTERKLLVSGDVPPNPRRPLTIVGTALPRIDALDKVTGRAVYAGDVELTEKTLYMKLLRSPVAHARIRHIDSSKAEALPGVHAVIHRGKFPDWTMYFYLIPQQMFPEYVTWVGEEVAAVAAESIDVADEALQLIEIEYERKPHVLDVEDALRPGAPAVESLDRVDPDNIRAPKAPPNGNLFEGRPEVLKRGNIAKGFAEAEVVYEGTYTVPFQYHAPMQTRVALAEWDGNKLTIHESCQGLWMVREDLMKSLGLKEEQIRLIVKYQGGGFGAKAGAQRYLHMVSRLAMLTGRPVRFEQSRSGEFLSHPHRWSSIMWLKTGTKRDGTLTAIEGKFFVNIGTGSTYGNTKDQMILTPWKLYECPNVHLEQYGIYTNSQLTAYMRGVMPLMGNFAMEAHMDKVAYSLGVDPLEIRLKNYTIWGDQVRKIPYSSKNLDRCMKLVTDEIGWERRDAISKENEGKVVKRGIGFAATLDNANGFPPYKAFADVCVQRDGTVRMPIGTVDVGGGEATVLGMIAAEQLGVTMDRMKVEWGDSEGTKYSPSTHANRITAEMGPAVQKAAFEARKMVFELAARVLATTADRLESANNMIYIADNPGRSVSFEEVCANLPPEGATGTGSRIPNPSDWQFNVFAAKACEVEVDTETGHVRVLKVASAHDVGRTLNPKLIQSQHYGGVAMGLGFALTEEPFIDGKTGTMLNQDLHQYRLMTMPDCPEIVTFDVEAEDPFFAYSAKGLGNGTLIGIAPAVRAAVAHATGVWINDLPITPDKVLNALNGITNPKAPGVGLPLSARSLYKASSVEARDCVEDRGE